MQANSHRLTEAHLADPDQQPNPLIKAAMDLNSELERVAYGSLRCNESACIAAGLELMCAADRLHQVIEHLFAAKNNLAVDQ